MGLYRQGQTEYLQRRVAGVTALELAYTLGKRSDSQFPEHFRAKLTRFKQSGHVVYVDKLSRNATGKVLKFEVRQSVKL